eukprot:CAMPEP_0172412822 /NCGR_PEP_ID=MMETSP1061-20121228/78103_1 /TAXON_ID=37318 /ORGANISM="Pseudo-nitzschia pungens, Strain cf. pungens" /LENGTH=953 /DNA_ID=CAMNT_0013149069 /DNA_START=123 /DNA_END=2984 /DNA_ORIENTATION=-
MSEQDFKTPDRSTTKALSSVTVTGGHPEEKKEDIINRANGNTINTRSSATLVTPLDAFSTAAARKEAAAASIETVENKQVRFDGNKNKSNKNTASTQADGRDATTLRTVGSDEGDSSSTSSSSGNQRGLVSRRGGRCGSPGRRNLLPTPSAGGKEPVDSTAAVLEFKTFRSPGQNNNCENENENRRENSSGDTVPSVSTDRKKPGNSEISVFATNATSTMKGPPSQQHGRRQQSQQSRSRLTYIPVRKITMASLNATGSSHKKTNSVSFSPVPTPKINGDRYMGTPIKSPTGGRFTSLPTLDDDALGSPGAIFLSPTRTPTYLDKKTSVAVTKGKSDLDSVSGICMSASSMRAPLTPRTPKRELDRDRLLATPTDFAIDYGKASSGSSLLESSNVLAWLHSPTVNGIFSPGFGSMLNTPRGGMLKAPPTPTFSTSFFFSDVAGLPRGGECASPKSGTANNASDDEKRSGNSRSNNNIICISPLASYKTKGNPLGPNSPKINYKDMFASPAERSGMAMLGASQKARAGVQKGGNLDAVHFAERELMEDEDLSVLLQLASSTPRPAVADTVQSGTSTKSEGSKVFRKNEENENLPGLQLPIIGGRDGEVKGARLTRKTHSRDHNDIADDHRVRPITQTSGGPAMDMKQKNAHDPVKKVPASSSMHRPYAPMSSHFPHHESPYYPPLHLAHAGSMRVVVGVPPPNRGKSAGDSQRVRPTYTIGPRGDYPPPYPPPPTHYPHHRAVPPPHIHPHYNRYPPPPHSHAAHRHVPLYAAHPKTKASSTATKKQPIKAAPSKAGLKRPATSAAQKAPQSAKKSKKSSQTSGKKKNRSPPLVDKAERQKAAATIQAVNQASGGKNDKAAALAAAILRGVTMRPSGKWQAQLYFAGKSRYIGVFDTREKAALAYEIAREKLKSEKSSAEGGVLSPKRTESAVNAARKAAFEGVNERDPRLAGK